MVKMNMHINIKHLARDIWGSRLFDFMTWLVSSLIFYNLKLDIWSILGSIPYMTPSSIHNFPNSTWEGTAGLFYELAVQIIPCPLNRRFQCFNTWMMDVTRLALQVTPKAIIQGILGGNSIDLSTDTHIYQNTSLKNGHKYATLS